jgi:competence ComEA-like helix-hairpin-helix protein
MPRQAFPLSPSRRRGAVAAIRGRGSALVAVLWCLVLLGVVVVGALHTTTLELRLVKNHGDALEAHYLALAGIEKAKAVIYHGVREERAAGVSYSSRLSNDPEAFRDVRLGRGLFRVIRGARPEEGLGRLAYGVSDEESRLDVNLASLDELKKLPRMEPAVAAAIIDWRDQDHTPGPGGAEQEYYSYLTPPYRARNAPFETPRELLMVAGVTPELLLGEDHNLNGILDPEEDDGALSEPLDNADGILDTGWAGLLTLESSAPNLDARGKARVNIASAGEEELTGIDGISTDLAKAILAYRERRQFENIGQLLDVTAPQPEGASAQPGGEQAGGELGESPGEEARGVGGSSAAPEAGSGERLVSAALLTQIADEITTLGEEEHKGAININSAPAAVLACLGGITEELAAAIVSHRRQAGHFRNIAELLDVPGMTEEVFKQVCPRLTVRSGTYRIVSEGLVPSTGARKRLQVVVRIGSYAVETLYYQEDA